MRETVRAVVPFKTRGAKARLSPFLSPEERRAFSEAMLRDVLRSLTGTDITILATGEFDPAWNEARVQVDAHDLNTSLNAYIADLHDPTLIVMSDIPLIREWHVREMLSAGITLVPGRGGGTNAIFMRDPARFHVDFYEVSFLKHVAIAKQLGLPLKILDSFYLSTDIDKPEDLAEVLIHCQGESCEYLRAIGVRLSYGKSRIGVERG
ncbi:MAG: 2-phospho-L-lactate guanylyltransferase [Halobacteriota archaeon]